MARLIEALTYSWHTISISHVCPSLHAVPLLRSDKLADCETERETLNLSVGCCCLLQVYRDYEVGRHRLFGGWIACEEGSGLASQRGRVDGY